MSPGGEVLQALLLMYLIGHDVMQVLGQAITQQLLIQLWCNLPRVLHQTQPLTHWPAKLQASALLGRIWV